MARAFHSPNKCHRCHGRITHAFGLRIDQLFYCSRLCCRSHLRRQQKLRRWELRRLASCSV